MCWLPVELHLHVQLEKVKAVAGDTHSDRFIEIHEGASREKLQVKRVFANITLNIKLSFRRSSILYSESTVVILAPVNITKSLSLLCLS